LAFPVTLVTTFWGGAAKVESFELSAQAFMDENPNVTIDLINTPAGAATYNSKIVGMFAAGTAPDVMNVNPTPASPASTMR